MRIGTLFPYEFTIMSIVVFSFHCRRLTATCKHDSFFRVGIAMAMYAGALAIVHYAAEWTCRTLDINGAPFWSPVIIESFIAFPACIAWTLMLLSAFRSIVRDGHWVIGDKCPLCPNPRCKTRVDTEGEECQVCGAKYGVELLLVAEEEKVPAYKCQ